MKARLQTSQGQHLAMTPQLRQAIRLLQMSSLELQAEITEQVETNPLLEWTEEAAYDAPAEAGPGEPASTAGNEDAGDARREDGEDWAPDEGGWDGAGGGGGQPDDREDAAERMAEPENLADHLLWQLHLSHLSPRDRRIGAALIDALDEDGYLREPLEAIA